MIPATDQYFVFPFTKNQVKQLIKAIDAGLKFLVLRKEERNTLEELELKLKEKLGDNTKNWN